MYIKKITIGYIKVIVNCLILLLKVNYVNVSVFIIIYILHYIFHQMHLLWYRVLSGCAHRKQITFTCSSYFLSYFYGASHRHLVGLPITILSIVVWVYLYIQSSPLCM